MHFENPDFSPKFLGEMRLCSGHKDSENKDSGHKDSGRKLALNSIGEHIIHNAYKQ